ncbi:MAG: 3-keto-disaccharide hydrolase [Bacteroidales bacterium]
MKNFVIYCMIFLVAISCTSEGKKEKEEWIQLFNGKNLDNWFIKIKGHKLGENYNNTFRVEDGILKVSYDNYEKFNASYGHIFYKTPFSYYKMRIEYRFVGEQCPEGPSWAFRNNGIMFHCQSPESMLLDQDFPVSIEAQLLGGDGVSERTTMNVCTPGTHIVMDSNLITQHCTNSKSKTYHGDVWVTAELVVYGDSIIHHIVNGDTVLTYSKPQVGGSNKPVDYSVPDGTLLKEGYIALQAESHPTEFRKVELLDLSKEDKSK